MDKKMTVPWMEQLVMEPAREEVMLHGVDMSAPLGNSDHNTVRCNIWVRGRVAGRYSIITFNFKKGMFSKMRVWGKDEADRENEEHQIPQ